jgi:protein-disulfide isomerase
LIETFGDRLLFVFRHFSMTIIHPFAARAAEAAARQGIFWLMHETLLDNQPN